MKAWKITLYIFATIALLAVVCFLFPSDGIKLGSVTLDFPSVAEVLTPANSQPGVDPMELLNSRQAELDRLKAMEEANDRSNEEYEKALQENPTAICFPGGDYKIFDQFFAACDSAKNNDCSVRVVHFGDSQIEEDRISYRLREQMQKKFGGQGVGIQPIVQTVNKITVTQRCNAEPRRYMLFGDYSLRNNRGHYGPMGQSCQVQSGVSVSYTLNKVNGNFICSSVANRCKVLLGEMTSPSVTISVNEKSRTVSNNHSLYQAVSFTLPDSTKKVQVSIQGNTEVLGVMIDGNNGISVDNVPMRGSSGTAFQEIAKEQFAPFLRNENVRMIILEYGGNTLPSIAGERNLKNYHDKMAAVIKYIKSLAPQASILFIGPSDMSTRVKGQLQTYPMLEPMVEMLKKLCAETGIAYWDLYSVMGGHNSMIEWANAKPQLAGRDYVHFTHEGANKVGDLLFQSMMLNYDYYKMRQKQQADMAAKR